jgi:hypothetical protein
MGPHHVTCTVAKQFRINIDVRPVQGLTRLPSTIDASLISGKKEVFAGEGEPVVGKVTVTKLLRHVTSYFLK